jgi:hypothetical protein
MLESDLITKACDWAFARKFASLEATKGANCDPACWVKLGEAESALNRAVDAYLDAH